MKRGLGKGLSALIPEGKPKAGYLLVGIEEIKPNASQPRKEFNTEAMDDLSASIKEKGIIQPLILRKSKTGYEIIVGERRWRAAQRAGLKQVPAIVKDVDNREALELALVENLQREDLNPLEEAQAYEQLINNSGLSHEQISARIGKDRSTITNQLRLLKLPEEAKRALISGEITPGHARALLGIQSIPLAKKALRAILKEKLSVRKTENLVKTLSGAKSGSSAKKSSLSPYIGQLSNELKKALGTQVRISDKGGRGRIEIEYYSNEELQRLIELLVGKIL